MANNESRRGSNAAFALVSREVVNAQIVSSCVGRSYERKTAQRSAMDRRMIKRGADERIKRLVMIPCDSKETRNVGVSVMRRVRGLGERHGGNACCSGVVIWMLPRLRPIRQQDSIRLIMIALMAA